MKSTVFKKLLLIFAAPVICIACGTQASPHEAIQNGTVSAVNLQAMPPDSALAYPWLDEMPDESDLLVNRIPAPSGAERIALEPIEWGYWLRYLPLKAAGSPVMLYDGTAKGNQAAHAAVFNMDVGQKDLQQCADAVMRLRAEYLRLYRGPEAVHFNFTSGDRADYSKWTQGYRPVIGQSVSWVKKSGFDDSYATFRDYMNIVFTYAGTASLTKELRSVNPADLQPGDVFIRGGFPGHAVLVLDVAVREGRKLFLLGQSYMPAQEFHLLKNPRDAELSPWYELNPSSGELVTPEWVFPWSELKRFEE